MGKKGIVFIVLAVVLLLSGCETTKGLGKGAVSGVASTAEGIGKDSYSTWKFILAADNWIKDNLW